MDYVPRHVAIIMDGNGRWAKQQGENRLFGHHSGVDSVRQVTEGAAELGIDYVTLYTVSTENWNRPESEVMGLMSLLVNSIEQEMDTFAKNNIRFMTIGEQDRLPIEALEKLQLCRDKTANNSGLTLILALSYSSRWELTESMRSIAREIECGELKADEIGRASWWERV